MSVCLSSPFGSSFVNFSTFNKVCLAIGQAREVKLNESATVAAFLINLTFSSRLMEEHKALTKKDVYTSSAQLVSNHTISEITGSQMLSIVNFPIKQIGKMMSHCLVTGVQSHIGSYDDKRATTVFMRPSLAVELGSRVGILAQDEILEINPRNLTWPEFSVLDLRIGTIRGISVVDSDYHGSYKKVQCAVNFGEIGDVFCMGLFQKSFKVSSLVDKQVLVLTNLNPLEVKDMFELEEGSSVCSAICTVKGLAYLEPAKPVDNGFRLA